MYALIRSAVKLLFGCHHHRLSRVFTLEGHTYKICWQCGARLDYSLEHMALKRPKPSLSPQPERYANRAGLRRVL